MQTIAFLRQALPAQRLVVRGTVQEVIPGKIVRLWIFKKTILPKVKIKIDDMSYERLRSKLWHLHATQEIVVTWGNDERPVPKIDVRVWVTLAYAGDPGLLWHGMVPLALRDVEIIENESDAREHELFYPQIHLPRGSA